MLLAIADILSSSDLDTVRAALARARFVDGKATAGWSARLVKDNLQAVRDEALEAIGALVEARLGANATFALAARPKSIIGPLFSRYEAGHAYGLHVDDALLDGRRSDVSFTLFLSEPDTYAGGELVIDTPLGEEAVKLAAGSVFVYPATMLHRVAPVASGVREAAVGWVRSTVRDAAQRELLFDLETARRRLFDREGKSADGDLLARCAANLMRMWCED
ncbi:MAG: Fe2+-dependent dioxygenase [Hyphomicrobiaceae bacterium]|nr:Fe2+-dependent dioxygenase [Hyphomicrobiaceae bacterium]